MLEHYYKNIIRQDLITKFCFKNIHEIPQLEQVILTFSLTQTSLKTLLPLMSSLFLISSQKPFFLVSKRYYITLKTKAGIPNGCRVNLRGGQCFKFLENLIFVVLPRVKNLKYSFFTKSVNISLENVYFFREIEKEYEYFQDLPNLNINLLFKAKNQQEIEIFLGALRFPLVDLKN